MSCFWVVLKIQHPWWKKCQILTQILMKSPENIHVPQTMNLLHFWHAMNFASAPPSGQNATFAHKLQHHMTSSEGQVVENGLSAAQISARTPQTRISLNANAVTVTLLQRDDCFITSDAFVPTTRHPAHVSAQRNILLNVSALHIFHHYRLFLCNKSLGRKT